MRIERELTNAEKHPEKGFKDINSWAQDDIYVKLMNEKNIFLDKCCKDRVPFDNLAAQQMIDEKIDEIKRAKELAARTNKGMTHINLNINWKQFAGEDKFEKLPDELKPSPTGRNGIIERCIERTYVSKITGARHTFILSQEEIVKEKETKNKQNNPLNRANAKQED